VQQFVAKYVNSVPVGFLVALQTELLQSRVRVIDLLHRRVLLRKPFGISSDQYNFSFTWFNFYAVTVSLVFEDF
jgi:hypothetical protein